MKILAEFKTFAVKGNAVDLAVGIVIGTAFGNVVNSLVSDIIMPPLGMLLGDANVTDLAIILKPATAEQAAVSLNYGVFVSSIIDFLIIAFALFVVIRYMNKLQKEHS